MNSLHIVVRKPSLSDSKFSSVKSLLSETIQLEYIWEDNFNNFVSDISQHNYQDNNIHIIYYEEIDTFKIRIKTNFYFKLTKKQVFIIYNECLNNNYQIHTKPDFNVFLRRMKIEKIMKKINHGMDRYI
jgi:hypothetical protein